MVAKNERISFDLPAVPYALRAFIERAVTDERVMLSFVESPGTALRAAGVPIDMSCLTRGDCDRLTLVLGRLRNLVASGNIKKDFRFEQVFTIGATVEYQEQTSHSESYAAHNFDHSQDGQTAENKSSTEGGIKDDFSKAGLGRKDFGDIVAPLINPGDLAAITALMQANLSARFEGK